MLGTLNRFIVNCSQSWWKILLLFAGQSATLLSLSAISESFPEVTAGDVPFDMQNDLTPEQIFEQLAGYSEQAFSQYYLFQAIDFVFPLFAGLFLASLCAFALRHASSNWYDKAVAKNLFCLLLLATVFDYLENINLLMVVSTWPEQSDIGAMLAVGAKQLKLASMTLGFAVTGVFLLMAAGRWLGLKAGLLKA
jgi:hypothetical protein